MKKFRNSESGFTLVELMVVVAIIGILSAVAIPNFKKYQSKSKMSEAKLALSAIYMAESSFMGDADTYATCLFNIGYAPTGGSKTAYDADAGNVDRYYNVGFITASAVTASNQVNGIPCTEANRYYSGAKGGTVAGVPAVGATADGTTFKAGASGVISSDFKGANSSQMTIDENKKIIVVQQGF